MHLSTHYRSRISSSQRLRDFLSFIIVVGVSLMLSGCQIHTPVVTPPVVTPVTVTPPVAVTTKFASVTNFGDSITCGYYALPNDGRGYMYSMEGYATDLDTALTAPATYLCRQGDMAADMARLWVYPNAQPVLSKDQLFTVLIGTNDAHFCGPSAGCLSNWKLSLAASLAWLGLPATDKVLGSAMTVNSGTWKPDTEIVSPAGSAGAFIGGVSTTNSEASLSFNVRQVVAGRSLYIAYRIFDPSARAGGTVEVAIDGVNATSLTAANANQPIATQNGTTDTIVLATLPLGAVGKHVVTITTTSAEGSFFSVLWAGASAQIVAGAVGFPWASGAPIVAVGSITATGQDLLNQWVTTYNNLLTPLVAGLVADGMNIVIAPTGTALDTSTDMVDLLHPGTAGHAKLAAAFQSVLAKPGT